MDVLSFFLASGGVVSCCVSRSVAWCRVRLFSVCFQLIHTRVDRNIETHTRERERERKEQRNDQSIDQSSGNKGGDA